MTADTRLRDLPAAVRAAMVDGDRGQISAAVAALREYAVAGLGQPALDVADGLEQVVKNPTSEAAVTSFAAATRRLDQAMEVKCHIK
jgi:hypothetical protein